LEVTVKDSGLEPVSPPVTDLATSSVTAPETALEMAKVTMLAKEMASEQAYAMALEKGMASVSPAATHWR
jgi:hypothetical protein